MTDTSCNTTVEGLGLGHVLHKIGKSLDWKNLFALTMMLIVITIIWKSDSHPKNQTSERLCQIIRDAQNELERRRYEPTQSDMVRGRRDYGSIRGRDEENQL